MADGGQQFGKYRIDQELGTGGFATVYKAVDTTLDREVALKILHPPLLADRRFVQNFRQEAKTLAALRHPHIITIYEIGEIDGRIFIAMDLAHGLSLAQSIAKRGHIQWVEILALLKPVCEALDYAHSQNIVHRDLKPANLLLDMQRGAQLTDFGFARLMAENTASMTMSGGIVGTPGYIAPEVWESNAADAPVDIYAVGCIVYEMLTGDVLFKGQTPIQAMRAHDRGPQLPVTWPADVPTNIATVLSKALARDPDTRYLSAGALWRALNDLAAQEQAASDAAQLTALAAQWRAEAERALAAKDVALARKAIEGWRAVAPTDAALHEAQGELGRQVKAAREAAQREALATQYRAEAEKGISARDEALARKAIENWRALMPGDAAIQEMQRRLEQLILAQNQSTLPVTPDISQEQLRTVSHQPLPQPKRLLSAGGGSGWKILGGAGGLIAVLYVVSKLFNGSLAPPLVASTNAAVVEAHSTAAPKPSIEPSATIGIDTSATPAATHTPQPTFEAGSTLYSDNFDSELTSHFMAETTESAVYKFVDGTYQITVTKPNVFWWRRTQSDYGDASISVDASINGPSDHTVGLIFHYQDDKNYYIYEVDVKGYYRLNVLKDSLWITLVDWTASSSIKPVGESNILRVETHGITIRLYVNDILLRVISDATFDHGDAGLVVRAFDEPNVTGTFDNLVVRSLQ